VPAARFSTHAARRAPARAHVFRERGELRKVLLDARRDEIARTLAAHEQALVDEPVDGLAHRDARDRKVGSELALGRQGIVGAQHAAFDGLAQRALQLLVERQAPTRIQGP
jgi:hypothetical protein